MTIASRTAGEVRHWMVSLIALSMFCCAPGAYATEQPANQPPLQIWFVRHAQSQINVDTHPHTLPDAGVSYPLTKEGVDQALTFADSLAAGSVIAIYTSTLLRAVQTSDAVAFRHRMALMLAPEAVEIDLGIDRESPEFGAVYDELVQKWLVEGDIEARHGVGESLGDVQRRFLPFVRELMNRHAHDSGVVVVMGHGATLGFLVPMLAGNVPGNFALDHPLPHTGVIKTELRDNSLICTEWAGIADSDFDETNP